MERIIRSAEFADFDAISNLDREVIESDSIIQGFSIASPKTFRGMDFLDLVVVRHSSRRQGIATLLISHFRKTSTTSKCWTSTNESNHAMISLLRELNWHESDHVEELDLGDLKLFFYIS